MGSAFVGATTASGTATTLSQGSMPTSAAGNYLLWVISTTNFEGNAASFSVPGDWALVASIVDSSFPSELLSVYSKPSAGAEAAPTVTISDGGATGRRTLAHMLSYRAVSPTTPVDASNTGAQTTTATTATSVSATTTAASTKVVSVIRNFGSATATHSWAASTERTDAAGSGGGGFLRMSVADTDQLAAGPSATEVVTVTSSFDNRQFIVLALRPAPPRPATPMHAVMRASLY